MKHRSHWRRSIQCAKSLEAIYLFSSVLRSFKVLSCRGPAWIASQETEEKDPNKKEDDRVYGNLEGKHEYRPRLSKRTHLMWLRAKFINRSALDPFYWVGLKCFEVAQRAKPTNLRVQGSNQS